MGIKEYFINNPEVIVIGMICFFVGVNMKWFIRFLIRVILGKED